MKISIFCNFHYKEAIQKMSSSKKKKPVQRQFVSASGAKTSAPAKKPAAKSAAPAKKPAAKSAAAPAKKPASKKPAQVAYVSAENKKKANGLRIGAVVLWLLAIAFEVLTILVINGTLYIPGNQMVYIIVGIGLDLVCVFIGSQLWKNSNDLDPCSKKNKLKFFLWNQMGIIAAVIAFFPLLLLLLKEDDLDPKTKKILSIIAAVVMLFAVGTSIDYNPTSAEDLAQAQSDAYDYSFDGTAYWTTFGKCYHFNPDCHTIINSNPVYTGTVEEAFEANRNKPCSYCAVADGEELFERGPVSGADLSFDEFISGSDISGADVFDEVSFADLADAA